MTLVDNVWSQDEFHVGMAVEIRNDKFLIGWPTAACYKDIGHIVTETFHQRQFLCLTGNIDDAVETCIAYDSHIVNIAPTGQQLTALLVLNKEVGNVLEHTGIGTTVPTEENGITADKLPVLNGTTVLRPCPSRLRRI